MANPIVTVKHLGPYTVDAITDEMFSSLVVDQGIPLILHQQVPIMGGMKSAYAVLANRDVRLVCSGCFRRDTRLNDKKRCKMCGSFVKHFDTKDGVRRLQCKEDGLINHLEAICTEVVVAPETPDRELDNAALIAMVKERGLVPDLLSTTEDNELLAMVEERGLVPETLSITSDNELLHEMSKRDLGETLVNSMEEEQFALAIKAKGFKTLYEANPVELLHELVRLHGNTTHDVYYAADRVDDDKGPLPHWTDRVGGKLLVTPTGRGTRQYQQTELHIKDVAKNDRDWIGSTLPLTHTEAETTKTPEGSPARPQRKRKEQPPKRHAAPNKKRAGHTKDVV